jgi:hypothetical protein
MIENIRRITCDDTGNTYELPSKEPLPQLWFISIKAHLIDKNGVVEKMVTDEQVLILEDLTALRALIK